MMSQMVMEDHPTEHKLWPYFIDWIQEEDDVINLEYEDDWSPWWDCFCAGAIAHIRKESLKELK